MLKFKFKIVSIILIIIVVLSITYNKMILPIVIEVSQNYATTEVNKQINKAYKNIIQSQNLSQLDFTPKYNRENMQYVNTNTVLVNNICNQLAEDISTNLNNIENQNIKLPIGILLVSNILSDLGPSINIAVDPIGQSTVDYDSSFTSCGVNQINYKLWLNISSDVSIVTPITKKILTIKRKMMIIDIVYNGGVPKFYVDK